MPDSMPEHFSDWNEKMLSRHSPESFHNHPQAVVRWVEGARVRAVLRMLAPGPNDAVLEIGCGAGNVLARIAAKERVGLDLSEQMVEKARGKLGAGARIVQGDAESLPFGDGRFDRVVCTSVLSHVLHPDRVLQEAYRVLKPGGRMVVSVSHEDAIERGIRMARGLFLGGLLLGKDSSPTNENVYTSEYHLHRFNLDYLHESAKALPRERALKKVPVFLYPVHFVALYEKA